MAGINVPQYEIFKIGTDQFKYNNWDLTISKNEALKFNELIALFEAQEFRLIAQILNKPISEIDFSDYILTVVISKKTHFKRAVSKKGIRLNGNTFRRFVGTTGGLKNNSLIFVNIEVLDELNRRCECGRDKSVKLVPAKYEAYKALTCSASQPICDPNHILVVSDALTRFKDKIIQLDNTDSNTVSPKLEYIDDADIENNATDGFNLCTIDYMKRVCESLGIDYVSSGVCLRNAWLKGMLYPFPIVEFFDTYLDDIMDGYIVTDIWGNKHDIRTVDMILTESSLKLWKCYKSIDEYVEQYHKNGYCFSVTKISPDVLDDQRELNYQYLQSYDFDDEDIRELCAPTVKYLKDSFAGDYDSTIKFLGITGKADVYTWQRALFSNELMLKDPYVIDCIYRMIKKKINNAKMGKLIVNGNYQIASGDPFILMQHIAGLKETGLLKARECYSKYWSDKDVEEVVIFRSPMTSHNNIRKCIVSNSKDADYWYRYMGTIMIINSWDTFCMAENGCDYDSDLLFSTNNPVLLRKHVELPAIACVQHTVDKVEVTESGILKSNLNGMGNNVGTITNRVTSMMETQAHYEKGSKEWNELEYRITCGQDYQQNEIDKLKGIKTKSMPSYWYHYGACKGDKFLQSVCTDKRPYFMIYARDDYRAKYNKYISATDERCLVNLGLSLDELINKYENGEVLSDPEHNFLMWYYRRLPFGMGACSMNKICWHIESEFSGYKIGLKRNSDFDYTVLKVKRRCTKQHKEQIEELMDSYIRHINLFKHHAANQGIKDPIIYNEDTQKRALGRQLMASQYRKKARAICPNDDERLNIVLDICYGENKNKMFCWDIVGDLICTRLEELNYLEGRDAD